MVISLIFGVILLIIALCLFYGFIYMLTNLFLKLINKKGLAIGTEVIVYSVAFCLLILIFGKGGNAVYKYSTMAFFLVANALAVLFRFCYKRQFVAIAWFIVCITPFICLWMVSMIGDVAAGPGNEIIDSCYMNVEPDSILIDK